MPGERTTDGNHKALKLELKNFSLLRLTLSTKLARSLKKHTMIVLDMEVTGMLKACGYCGRMHDINATCPERPAKHYRKTDADRLRNTYRWRKKRAQIRQDAHHMCEVCRDKGIITNKHLEVHHIVKLNTNPGLLTDDDNLICLCVTHHKQADAGQLNPTYLTQLAHKRNQ